MTDGRITITLRNDEALVLFEFLARLESASFKIEHHSEQVVLWRIHGQLESVLVEPLRGDYPELLAAARQSVAEETA